MNTNPIIIQPAQNPNSGNIPFYSFNITLYPCQDASLISPNGPTDSPGLQQSSKTSFSENNSYFPRGWNPIPQPPPLTANGNTITIPVPVPNSIYQCFQNFPNENINTYNQVYAPPNQFSNSQRDYNKDFTLHRSNVVPVMNFTSISSNNNSPSYVIPRGEYLTNKSFQTSRTNSRIPPLPPPPPPQYFTTSRSNREEFEKCNHDPESSERNFRQLHQTLLDDLKEDNLKRYNISNVFRSTSCPQNHFVIPAVDYYSVINQGNDRNQLEEIFSNRDERFKGGGDSSDSYSPENSEEKISCECTVCRDRFEEQQRKNSLRSLNDMEGAIHKSIPHIASSVLWEQMNSDQVKAYQRLVDKITHPDHSIPIDPNRPKCYDTLPVWEFQKRPPYKFQRVCRARTQDTSIQCDVDLEFPKASAQILWSRANKNPPPNHSEQTQANNDEDREDYVKYVPQSAPRHHTTIIGKTKTTVSQTDQDQDQDLKNNNVSDYEDDVDIPVRETSVKFSANSNRTDYSEKPNDCSPKSSTSSIVYQSRRPTFEEVMEYLENADEQERQELGLPPKHKSSVSEKHPNKNTNSQLRREDSNSDIYGIKYEKKYKKDFQKVNPPKEKANKRPSNYNKYQDSYTEVVCQRPPEEMFPEQPGPLDFPKNALGRVLTFLDSNYWQQVLDGFRLAVRLARHHQEILCQDLRHVIWKSEKHLASLKSAVSRAALACFTELILNVGKAIEPFIDKILAKILLKSMDCNKFLRWECRNVLNAIVYALPVGRSLSCLEIGFKHKSAMVRATISIMLKKWVIKVGTPKVIEGYADRILPMIITLLQERGWEARAGAKDAMNLLITHPNFMGVLRTCVPYEELIEVARRVKCIRDLMEQDIANYRM